MNVLSIGNNDYLNYYYKFLFENIYKTNVRIYKSEEEVPFVSLKESKIIIIGSDLKGKKLSQNLKKIKNKKFIILNSSSTPISQFKNNFIHPFDVSSINYHITENNISFRKGNIDFYIEIPYKILEMFLTTPCQIYTRRSESKYDLIYSAEQAINLSSKKKYYITRNDYALFFKNYLRIINKKQNLVLKTEDLQSYVRLSYELFSKKDVVIPKEHLNEMTAIISETINNISTNREAFKILNQILNQNNFFINHSFFLLYLTSYIARELFNEEDQYSKITIASIFHDFKLKTDQNQLLEKELPENTFPEDNTEFINHAVDALDIIKRLKIDDPDIANMIRSHHDLPNRKLEKSNKEFNSFTNLEFLFNICHYTTVLKFNNYSSKQILEKLMLFKDSHPLFQPSYNLISDVLNN